MKIDLQKQHPDKASAGLSYILRKAREQNTLIYLSGSGADETLTDYGGVYFPGHKAFRQSQLGGDFPRKRMEDVFPWSNFFLGRHFIS